MHFRQILISGTALTAAAILAACGGGGGGSHAALPVTATTTPTAGGSNTGTLGVSHIVVHVKRGSAGKKAAVAHAGRHSKSKARTMAGKRKPAYVASAIAGIQVTVTSGSASKTVYADVSGSSALCTPNGNSSDGTADETCTISAPIMGANESVTVDELDQQPTDDGSAGNAPGMATVSRTTPISSQRSVHRKRSPRAAAWRRSH